MTDALNDNEWLTNDPRIKAGADALDHFGWLRGSAVELAEAAIRAADEAEKSELVRTRTALRQLLAAIEKGSYKSRGYAILLKQDKALAAARVLVSDVPTCPECDDAITFPHYHRDTLDGPEVVRIDPADAPTQDADA